MEIWENEIDILNNKDIYYRERFAKKLKKQHPTNIIKQYTYHSLESATNLISIINKYSPISLDGIGIELGAGTGLFSNVLVLNGAKKIYSVELVPSVAQSIIPKVAKHFLNNQYRKLIPVQGSFDNIQLPEQSVDFIFEYDSFHHSYGLENTFKESYNKLKTGGVLILVDRCHPDSLSDKEVNNLLDIKIDQERLIKHGFPKNMTLTRRENGEHEYRKREWVSAIKKAGFKIHVFRTFYNKVRIKQLYWYLLGKLKKQKHIDKRNLFIIYLAQNFGIYLNDFNTLTPMKEIGYNFKTVGILIKR